MRPGRRDGQVAEHAEQMPREGTDGEPTSEGVRGLITRAAGPVQTAGKALVALGALCAALFGPLGNTTLGLALALLGTIVCLASAPNAMGHRFRAVVPLSVWVLTAWAAVSAVFSTNPAVSAVTGLAYMLAVVLALLIGDTIVSGSRAFQGWIVVFLAIGGYTTTVATAWDRFHRLNDRPNTLFTGPNAAGTLCAAMLFIAIGLTLSRTPPRWQKALLAPVIPLVTFALALTLSRGAMLGAAVGLALLCLASRLSAVLAVLVAAAGAVTERLSPYFAARLHSGFGSRGEAAHIALHMIRDHPVAGVGAGTFVKVYPTYHPVGEVTLSFAHNIFLQVAAEFGIPGLLVFCWVLYDVLSAGLRGSRTSWVARGLAIALVSSLVHDQVDCIMYGLEIGGAFFILSGVLMSIDRRQRAEGCAVALAADGL